MLWKILLYFTVILLLFIPPVYATHDNGYKITYTINVKNDGNAIWNVEYRTVLETEQDFSSYDNYTKLLQSVYLNEFKNLMKNSVSQAVTVTSRGMDAIDFTGNSAIQTTPTGKYGVIHYSFTWTNFAIVEENQNINIGDVFVGGLYLSKDDALIIQYPSNYKVIEVTPQPDTYQDKLVWYGLRDFKTQKPTVILSKIEVFPYLTFAIIIIIVGSVGFFIYRYKRKKEITSTDKIEDVRGIEERIIQLLKENKGELYQSDIGKRLEVPKSTLSSALNELYNKKQIQKIKKGRENLIRLVKS